MSLAVGGVLVSVFDLVSLHCQCDGRVMSAALFQACKRCVQMPNKEKVAAEQLTRHTADCRPSLPAWLLCVGLLDRHVEQSSCGIIVWSKHVEQSTGVWNIMQSLDILMELD